MSGRKEFTKKTRKLALERSGMRCEAVGKWYHLDEGKRCNADLSYGVEFDHIVADSIGGDNSLENCAAVCIKCHRIKTAVIDTPTAAKTVRIRDKSMGIKSSGKKIQSQGFHKPDKQPKVLSKTLPPRRSMYE